ncbi:uncharacterized protein LOC124821163 [Vigna umbellata]|uniref:uncharacterized protein LOC124821163 n=1 Tax=Vigna umbellata TaxID=87088 RepID=UPI001F5F6149|nr:uncharacterized protein LOC124821163 [Vigna umbellata]
MITPKFVQPAISKFDGHYDFWTMTMENFLRSKELWSLVEVGIPTLVIGSGSSGEAHKGIVEYQGSTRVKHAQLQALRKEFELLTMKEGEKVDYFLCRTMTIVSKMKSNGEVVEQSAVVSKILRSLTPKFNYIVCAIEESNDINILTIDELHVSLLVHEQRMIGVQEEEHVLKATHEHTSSRSTQEEKLGGFIGSRGRGKGRQSFNKATIECFKCHRLGKFQYECPD